EHADNNLPAQPHPGPPAKSQPADANCRMPRQRPARRPLSSPGTPPPLKGPPAYPPARRGKPSTGPAAGQRKPPAAPPDGIARPEPVLTILIGLDLFHDWYRPGGFSYQHGF